MARLATGSVYKYFDPALPCNRFCSDPCREAFPNANKRKTKLASRAGIMP